jgi:hypothetical protein
MCLKLCKYLNIHRPDHVKNDNIKNNNKVKIFTKNYLYLYLNRIRKKIFFKNTKIHDFKQHISQITKDETKQEITKDETKEEITKEIAKVETKQEIAKVETKQEITKDESKQEIAKDETKQEIAKENIKLKYKEEFKDEDYFIV